MHSDKSNADQWERAVSLVEAGELIVFPTDTVYGIGCDPWNAEAIQRIYEAKGRETTKAIPLLLSDVSGLQIAVTSIPLAAEMLGRAFWPGALTLVLPRRPELPKILSGSDTVAVRVPDHEELRGLIARAGGALAATSANRSGEPDTTDAESARRALSERVALVIDGGQTRGGVPSTVVDCTVSPVRVLREGAISEAAIRAVLGEQG
jgi:L-threonylcarbamoyladenylate synthase